MARILPQCTKRDILHALIWFSIAALMASIAVSQQDLVTAGSIGSAMFMPLCAGVGVLFGRGARGLLFGEYIALVGWTLITFVALFAI
jgi:hypothetical protein